MPAIAKWGAFKWGQLKWGQQDTTAQYGQANAWDDTVLLIVGATDLNEDQSQFATDLSSQAETNSARAAIAGTGTGREILWRGGLDQFQSTTLVEADQSGSDRWSITFDGSDFDVVINGSVAATITTAIIDFSIDDVSVMFVSRPNPDTTGAANVCRGLLLIYNHTDGTEERKEFAHAASTFDGTETLQYGLDANSTVTTVRVGRAWHDPVEFYEEFVSGRAATTSQALTRAEPLRYKESDGISDADEFFGQAHHAGAVHMAREVDLRLATPLVNEAYANPATITPATATGARIRYAPGSSEYLMDYGDARWVMVPPNCDRLRARVQVRTYATDASTPTIGVRVYCADNLPNNPQALGQQTLKYSFTEATISADHTSTTGEYLELGEFEVVRSESVSPGWHGSSFVFLALASEPGGTPDTNDRVEIGAIHVWPVKRSLAGGGPAGGLVQP